LTSFLDRTVTLTETYLLGSVPLSSIANVAIDRGGRDVSSLDFFQVVVNNTSAHVSTYVSFRRVTEGGIQYPFAVAPEPINLDLIEVSGTDKVYRVQNGTVIKTTFKYPHLYIADIHVVVMQDADLSKIVPSVRLVSVNHSDDTFHALGTKGVLSAEPYAKVGQYYSRVGSSPYRMGNSDGAILALAADSGITMLDGSVSIFGRKMPTFMGVQVWLKYEGGDSQIIIGAGEQSASFAIQSSGDRATFATGDSTIESEFLMYQDGRVVRTPTLFKGVWTSVGIALDTPIASSAFYPELILGTGIMAKNVIMYGGDSLEKLLNFRTWAQVAASPEFPAGIEWAAWATDTWQGVLTLSGKVPSMDIGAQYLGTIGSNRYVVGEDEGAETKSLYIIDSGVSISSKDIADVLEERVVVSTPTWSTLGSYSA